MIACPTCGQDIEQPPDDPLILTKYQGIIFRALSKRPRETTELIDILYSDDPNGGPDHPEVTIRSLISQMNRVLKEHNLRVWNVGHGRGGPGTYRLEELT